MVDREKVIRGLECCDGEGLCIGKKCPCYEDEMCVETLHSDALALLKAQEPKPVHVTADINCRKVGECPNCGKLINSGDYPHYCGDCGPAVKWE